MSVPASAFAKENTSLSQDAFVEEADEFVEVSEDGTIKFEIPDDVANQISAEELALYQEGIDNINALINDGVLEVTENGTIYEADDDELVIQGGNVDDYEWHWWGVRRYASKSSAAELAHDFYAISIGCGSVATVAGFLGPVGVAVAITTAIVGTGRAGLLANDIEYYNSLTDRGVIIDLRWVLTYSVSCQ